MLLIHQQFTQFLVVPKSQQLMSIFYLKAYTMHSLQKLVLLFCMRCTVCIQFTDIFPADDIFHPLTVFLSTFRLQIVLILQVQEEHMCKCTYSHLPIPVPVFILHIQQYGKALWIWAGYSVTQRKRLHWQTCFKKHKKECFQHIKSHTHKN